MNAKRDASPWLRPFLPLPTHNKVVVALSTRNRYFLYIVGDHANYWRSVRCLYPDYKESAKQFGGVTEGVMCPEFPSVSQLLSWLSYLKYGEVRRTLILAATFWALSGGGAQDVLE